MTITGIPAIMCFAFFWIGNMLLCNWLAHEKNREGGNWLLLALFFGVIATLVLVGAPVARHKPAADGPQAGEEQGEDRP